jgi:hypothetical protein
MPRISSNTKSNLVLTLDRKLRRLLTPGESMERGRRTRRLRQLRSAESADLLPPDEPSGWLKLQRRGLAERDTRKLDKILRRMNQLLTKHEYATQKRLARLKRWLFPDPRMGRLSSLRPR